MTIKELRESKGLSQIAFAESIGMSRSTVVAYENGKFKPSAAVVAKINEVYNINFDEAVPIAGEAKPVKRGRKKTAPAPIAEEKAVKREKKKAAPVRDGSVGAALKALRKAKGLSQKEFGETIGVSLPSVSAYEQGRIKPGEKVRAKIKEVYGPAALSAALDTPATPENDTVEKPAGEAPAQKKRARKKAAPQAEEKKQTKRGKKTAHAAAEKKPEIVIQSPLGGSITPEEILAKTGPVDLVYIRVDENKAYWVKGEETGSVDLW